MVLKSRSVYSMKYNWDRKKDTPQLNTKEVKNNEIAKLMNQFIAMIMYRASGGKRLRIFIYNLSKEYIIVNASFLNYVYECKRILKL